MYPFSLSKLARACEVGSGIWLSQLYFLDFIIHRQLRSLSVQVGLAFVQLGQPSFNLNDIILVIMGRLGCRCWIRWINFAWDNYFPKSLTDWATKLKYSLCKPHFFHCIVFHTNPLLPYIGEWANLSPNLQCEPAFSSCVPLAIKFVYQIPSRWNVPFISEIDNDPRCYRRIMRCHHIRDAVSNFWLTPIGTQTVSDSYVLLATRWVSYFQPWVYWDGSCRTDSLINNLITYSIHRAIATRYDNQDSPLDCVLIPFILCNSLS